VGLSSRRRASGVAARGRGLSSGRRGAAQRAGGARAGWRASAGRRTSGVAARRSARGGGGGARSVLGLAAGGGCEHWWWEARKEIGRETRGVRDLGWVKFDGVHVAHVFNLRTWVPTFLKG
jgi:hypothetical protein